MQDITEMLKPTSYRNAKIKSVYNQNKTDNALKKSKCDSSQKRNKAEHYEYMFMMS
jgi:hypothetical protein